MGVVPWAAGPDGLKMRHGVVTGKSMIWKWMIHTKGVWWGLEGLELI